MHAWGTTAEAFVPTFLSGLPLARRALSYAREQHGAQRRESDAAPFILHPLEVASLLHNAGHGEAVVAAGILHDLIEDTSTERTEIVRRFGAEVAALVDAVTEDETIESFEERKAALRAHIAALDGPAAAIFAADKVTKVRELRAHAGREPAMLESCHGDARARLDHYVESLRTLEQWWAEHPLVRQLRFELEALHSLPPRGVPPGL